ncbi:hypothetical protein Pan44_26490 [Caulifigura coniformis]|uniref:Uncharacterized protein n=1 Tax=Caulifigura coniformis TaxID=2527983 RepID=A0A517SEQ8_9PLAN|nr:hypothetical protein [Caulifigura coniformis]QDT54614.1 hypothetical protein Pan44_26490 [Caulifigura coniformis]
MTESIRFSLKAKNVEFEFDGPPEEFSKLIATAAEKLADAVSRVAKEKGHDSESRSPFGFQPSSGGLS